MRLYSFVNANYLKHVQHGLQTAHAVAELYNKYPEDTKDGNCVRYDLLNDWARNHKTIIILDGGDCQDLHDIVVFLKEREKALKLPYSYFKEDARSLNNALTAVAVVVPAEIYDVRKEPEKAPEAFCQWGETGYTLIKDGLLTHHRWPNQATEEFYTLLKSKGLAR